MPLTVTPAGPYTVGQSVTVVYDDTDGLTGSLESNLYLQAVGTLAATDLVSAFLTPGQSVTIPSGTEGVGRFFELIDEDINSSQSATFTVEAAATGGGPQRLGLGLGLGL